MRLFVAVELPAAWRGYLAEVQQDLERVAPGAMRWVHQEILHLTLVFLGDQPPSALGGIQSSIEAAAGATSPFRLELGQFGTFTRDEAVTVAWAGIEDSSARLQPLHQALTERLVAAGVALAPARFRPHVTLGRARGTERIAPQRLQAAVQSLPQRRRPASFPVRQVVLFRSQLFPSGPLYTALSEHPLGSPA